MSETVTEIVSSIWQSVLGLEVTPGEAPSRELDRADQLTACIQISGAWSGVVMASFPAVLSHKIASVMLDLNEAEATTEDARDCLSEIVNMIGGNLKATLPAPCSLSLPWVSAGGKHSVSVPHCSVVDEVQLVSEGSGLVVTIMAADPGASERASGAEG